jgi:hypothetical protein
MNPDQRESISGELLKHSLEESGLDLAFTEDTPYEQLCAYIRWLMEYKMDFLLSLMYRLDITESSIKKALHPGNPEEPANTLANLIIERQLNRIETKKKYSSGTNLLPGDMEW